MDLVISITQPGHQPPLGELGEKLAADYLVERGYRVVLTNFKTPVGRNSKGVQVTGEIDIIALDGETLCFVEVKTRLVDDGSALEAVDARKQARLLRGAAAWLREQRAHARRVRFDVIACEWRAGIGWRVSHLEGAFDASD